MTGTEDVLEQLSEDEADFVRVVRRFVDHDVIPEVHDIEARNEYPAAFIDTMKKLGVYGMQIPADYSDSTSSTACFALVTEELARGWMSLAGAVGGHAVMGFIINAFGTEEQRDRLLPAMSTGELRAAMALTEPQGGSDLQAIRTVAKQVEGGYLLNGTKMWITNARHAGVLGVLCKTDPAADPRHRGISILLVPSDTQGVSIPRDLPKLGYRGVESCEVVFDNAFVPAEHLLGPEEGHGFSQMMRGLEVGRIQVAARSVGVAQAALDASVRYSATRETFGVPIWQHQSIGNYLADMATQVLAARVTVMHAARKFDRGERCDLEAGIAKVFASESGLRVAEMALRLHGSAGYSTEYDVERYFRDAPLMIIGEGTNEIQRNLIARRLMQAAPKRDN